MADQTMRDHIRDSLSPPAVAAIAGHLLGLRSDDEEVNLEVQWFADQLIELLGGPKTLNRLCQEIGL